MKKTLIALSLIFVAFITISYKPISFSGNPKMINGEIISVSKDGIKDAIFRLRDNKNTFYINRGFENFEFEKLKSLVGKSVVIYYSDGWTPLDPLNNRSKSIEKLEVNNSVFFQE